MNVAIRSLTQLTETEWRVGLAVGGLIHDSQLLVKDGELVSFQIINPMVHDMLSLCGLEGQFSRHFFSYLDDRSPELPWDFGEQDDNTIEQVVLHYES